MYCVTMKTDLHQHICRNYYHMASSRQIRDEIMKMTIVVNSDPAQKAIYDLSKKNQDLKEKNDSLSASMKDVRSTLGKNSDEYKKLTSELNQNRLSITANEKEMERLRGEMDITQMTMQQLRKEAALLRTNLNNMVPGSQASIEMQAQLERVNARMSEVRTGANQTRTSFRGLADTFNHYQGIVVAGLAVFAGFALSVQQIIDHNNKLVDAQTAVAKTVNMTKQEVDELTKSFSAFDTRTSRIDLLKIAETGGRLGIGKDQIKEFVREVDKANVALGDGFAGGVEAVTDTLGKLKNLYGETKDLDMATAINQIGSAMNELGANGAATEQNIGEFALRLGSLPAKLKPTIAESLALGAAFEESGINAERAGTAYATFIRNAATNSEKFAKVMGISKKEVEDLMNADPLEFFLKFSEGMKGMDTTELAKTMEYLKMNDQYVISSMGAASENTDRFRKSIELSNQSLTKATSLTDEFNKVNNNTSAIFDKVQKKFLGMFTSEAVANTLNFLVGAFGKFIGAVEDSDGIITGFRNSLLFLIKTITLIMVTMVSYNLLTGVYNGLMMTAYQRVIALTVVEKARNLVTGIGTALTTLYRSALWLLAAGYSLLTGNTVGATFAMQGFNTAMKMNPIGLFITLIIAALTAVELFGKETNKAAEAQKNLNQITKEGVKNAAEEVGQLDKLYKAATNAALGKDAQRKAAEELIKLWPEQFKAGSEELIMNGKMAKSYHDVREAIISASRAKAAQAEIDKINADFLQKEEEIKQKMLEAAKNSKKANASQTVSANSAGAVVSTISSTDNRQIAKNRFKAETENLVNLYKERNKVLDPYIKYVDKESAKSSILKKPEGTSANSNYNSNFDSPDSKKEAGSKSTQASDRRHEKEMDDMRKKGDEAAALARQIELDIEDAKIEAMKEGYEKEITAINLQEKRKMAEIDKKKITTTEFDSLQRKIDKSKGDDKQFFESLKISWTKNNDELENLKLGQMRIFELKKQALAEKYKVNGLKREQELFNDEIKALETEKFEKLNILQTVEEQRAFLQDKINADEMVQIYTREEGKAAIEKYYNKKTLDRQADFLRKKIAEYYAFMIANPLKGLDEAQLKILRDYEAELAKLLNSINGLKSDSGPNADKGLKSLSNKGKKDILGLSADEWMGMFKNTDDLAANIGKISAAIGIAQEMFATYFAFVAANEKRQLQQYELSTVRKKNSLKKQLLDGYINQETYKKLTIKADQDLEKKKAEIALKQAKRERAMAIAQTISNTAMSIMSIWAQFPKFDFGATAAIMSGVVGALGAVQLATIMSQPLPTAEGFEDGFGMEYPMTRAQDGKRFNVRKSRLKSGLVDRPTHFIAGENNRVEMVVDNPTWTSYPPQLKTAIYAANARANGFESGFNTKGATSTGSTGNDEMMIAMMSLIGKNIEVLSDIKQTGIQAIIAKNARNGKEVDEMRNEYLDLKNKNKH